MARTQTETPALTEADAPVDLLGFLDESMRGVSALVLITLVSCLLTVVFLRVLPSRLRANEETDYFAFYQPVAQSILDGRGISRPGEYPATAYPPGFPIIVAGVLGAARWMGSSERAALAALSVTGMGLVTMFVFLMARMLWGAIAALVSATLWMTYPIGLWLTKQPSSEIPFMVIFYAALALLGYALMRRLPAWVFLLCGFLFGLATMIRPIAVGISLVLAIVVWFARRDIGARARALLIAALFLGNLAAVLPWEGWVLAKTGRVIPLSTNGLKSMRDGLTFGVVTKGYREPADVPTDVAQVMKRIVAEAPKIETTGQLASVMVREFSANPVAVTKLMVIKIARSWYGTDSSRRELLILLFQIAYLTAALWAGVRLWKKGGNYRLFAAGAILIVVYFWGMTILVLSVLRYMVPVMGLLFMMIGGAVSTYTRSQALNQEVNAVE
jgi:hypothetical protein